MAVLRSLTLTSTVSARPRYGEVFLRRHSASGADTDAAADAHATRRPLSSDKAGPVFRTGFLQRPNGFLPGRRDLDIALVGVPVARLRPRGRAGDGQDDEYSIQRSPYHVGCSIGDGTSACPQPLCCIAFPKLRDIVSLGCFQGESLPLHANATIRSAAAAGQAHRRPETPSDQIDIGY